MPGEIVVTGKRDTNHRVAYYLDSSGYYQYLEFDPLANRWLTIGSGPTPPPDAIDDPGVRSDTVKVGV